MNDMLKLSNLVAAVVYSLLGTGVFLVTFFVLDRITPQYNLWREILDKQNQALAIIVGAVSIGICIIVAAAIHG